MSAKRADLSSGRGHGTGAEGRAGEWCGQVRCMVCASLWSVPEIVVSSDVVRNTSHGSVLSVFGSVCATPSDVYGSESAIISGTIALCLVLFSGSIFADCHRGRT